MSRMALETAIRLSAEVKGGANITKVQRSLQDLAKDSKLTAQEMGTMRVAALQLAKANDGTVAGLRSSIAALRGLKDQAKIGGQEFRAFGADIQRLEAKLKGLDGTARAAGNSLSLRGAAASAGGSMLMGGGLQASMGAAAGSLAAAGTAAGMAMAGGVVAGGALIATSTTNALDEAASTRRVRTLTDDADNLMAKIRELTVEQGNLSNSTEAGAAAYEILSSGFSKTADVLAILKASTYGATGGFSDITTVADAATSIMNSFGLGADKVTRVVDQMVQTQNDGKIVVDQYARSVGRLAPTFAVAGLSVEEMNAAISALTAKGAPVESTMSGLNQTVKSIIKPTEEAKKVAAALGLEFSAAALQAKGLGGFLQDVTDKTKGNTTALGVLFSDIDGFKAVASLTNDGLKAYNKSLANMERETAQAAKAAKLAVDPVKQFDNAWKGLSTTLGQSVLPALTAVLEGLTLVIDKVRQVNWGQIAGDLPGLLDPSGPSLQVRPPAAAVKPPAGGNWNNMQWPEGIPRPGTAPPQPRMRAPRGPEDTAITSLVNGVVSGGEKTDWKPSSKAQALIAAAGKLGVSPLDLATLIQFESGGNPSRWGGAGGNYMGLIQFGPSERREYGANDKQSFEEQVQGPVVRYFQDRFKGVGMSTQGADLLKLYTTVLAGNPKANPNARDSFGTSARSGVAAMLRPGAQRDVAKRMYFGGDAANAGYSQVDAGGNLVKAWEEAQQLEKLRKDGLLTSARQLAILERQADVKRATTNEEKITASSDLARTERMYKFIDLLKGAQSEEQRMNILKQQGLEIQSAQVDMDREQLEYGKKLNDALLQRVGISGELLDQSRFTGTGAGARVQTFDLKGTLADTSAAEEKVDRLEQAAESSSQAIGGLFRDIISGTATAEESLSRMFQSIADSFASMVSDMIAEWAKTQIIGLFTKAVGSIGGGAVGGFGPTSSDLFSQGLGVIGSLVGFAGGGYTGSSPRAGGIDGQGGFPAILHPQETVIDHTRMMPVPYQASSAAAATGEPVVPCQGASAAAATGGLTVPYQSSGTTLAVPFLKGGGGDDGAASMPISNEPIRYESTVINGVEYVTKAEAEEIGRRSEQRTFKKLQNSPGARRAVGIR
jgi:TP901 family phage tail tape measure protein